MKFLFLGNYSNAGLAGFLKNPEDDRRAAISAMVEKSGGKFIDLQFLRGKYDIAVVAEVSSFEDAAAVKVLVVGGPEPASDLAAASQSVPVEVVAVESVEI